MRMSISGRAGSGKDTFADYLSEKYGFTKVSWAGNLKEMCKFVFGLTEEQVNTQEGKMRPLPVQFCLGDSKYTVLYTKIVNRVRETHDVDENKVNEVFESVKSIVFNTPRKILQVVGTEICRGLCDTYHTDVLLSKLKPNISYVITDSRFPNEVEIAAKNGFFTVKIERDMEAIADQTHASESNVDKLNVNSVISNNGTIEELYKKAELLIKFLDK